MERRRLKCNDIVSFLTHKEWTLAIRVSFADIGFEFFFGFFFVTLSEAESFRDVMLFLFLDLK